MANCEQYWDLISYSLDGALTEEEQRRLDRQRLLDHRRGLDLRRLVPR